MTIQECKELAKKSKDGWNATPYKKSKGWGLHGSTLLDRKTEEEAWNAWIDYLREKGQI
jgi:hypothetical protein